MEQTKLTPDTIVREAIALINEQGVQALTVRRLAQRIGIQAPTLYWYFPDKAALTAAMIETLFDRVLALAGEADDAKTWMRQFGRAAWQVLSEAPNTALFIMAAEARDASLIRNADLVEKAVAKLPGDHEELMLLQSSIQALMTGWAAMAHTSFSRAIAARIDVEKAAIRGLDTLIEGWFEN